MQTEKYFIIVIQDKILTQIHETTGQESAIQMANNLLEKRMQEINCHSDFVKNKERGEHWQIASDKSSVAWCGYHGEWYAHIAPKRIIQQNEP